MKKSTDHCPGCDPRWPINAKHAARYNRQLRVWVTCKRTRAEAARLRAARTR